MPLSSLSCWDGDNIALRDVRIWNVERESDAHQCHSLGFSEETLSRCLATYNWVPSDNVSSTGWLLACTTVRSVLALVWTKTEGEISYRLKSLKYIYLKISPWLRKAKSRFFIHGLVPLALSGSRCDIFATTLVFFHDSLMDQVSLCLYISHSNWECHIALT